MAFAVWNDKQVSDVLHVDLQEADCHSEHCLIGVFFDIVEDVLDGAWHDSKLILCLGHLSIVEINLRLKLRLLLLSIQITLASKDRMCLARASLAVRHDHAIEAVEYV